MSDEKKEGFKLRSLYIEKYKMFSDFNIDFVDADGNALPIVVIAGVNGSGKTTLLEFINNFPDNVNDTSYIETNQHSQFTYNFIKIDIHTKTATEKLEKAHQEKKHLKIFDYYNLENYIEYFPAGIDDIAKVESEFVKYWYNLVKFHNHRNIEITDKLQAFIEEVFDGLDLGVNYSYIDEDDNIYFQNSKNEKFKIADLSTGEKTLLSKVLYLFFKAYHNKVILIDEPELSLHPSWQNKILKIYENLAIANSCQIIIATHSPHIIGSANSQYLRVLEKDGDTIKVLDNISRSYGLEFDRILTDVMGVENLRTPDVAKDIKRLWNLIGTEEYQSSEYKELYQKLEEILGDLDKDLVLARLEIARIKSRNA